MFSDCSGECCLCGCAGGCLAGHGDDYFYPASKDQLIERLDKGEYIGYTELMKCQLKVRYHYDYDLAHNSIDIVFCHECGYYHHSHKTSNGVEFNFCNRPGEYAVLREPHDFCSRGRRKNDPGTNP